MRKNISVMLDSATGAVCETLLAAEVGARIVRRELEAYEDTRDLELKLERTELEMDLAIREHELDKKRKELAKEIPALRNGDDEDSEDSSK